MPSRGVIIRLAACCILVSAPVSYIVNTYQIANSIPPSGAFTLLLKFLPLITLSIVIIYGAREVTELADSTKTKEATHFIVILTVLLIVAIVVTLLTFDLGVRYIM
jgi:dolichyl-phosphate-mannose--protein O-mannosyl transferase